MLISNSLGFNHFLTTRALPLPSVASCSILVVRTFTNANSEPTKTVVNAIKKNITKFIMVTVSN